jgi:hypothetical protein
MFKQGVHLMVVGNVGNFHLADDVRNAYSPQYSAGNVARQQA